MTLLSSDIYIYSKYFCKLPGPLNQTHSLTFDPTQFDSPDYDLFWWLLKTENKIMKRGTVFKNIKILTASSPP